MKDPVGVVFLLLVAAEGGLEVEADDPHDGTRRLAGGGDRLFTRGVAGATGFEETDAAQGEVGFLFDIVPHRRGIDFRIEGRAEPEPLPQVVQTFHRLLLRRRSVGVDVSFSRRVGQETPPFAVGSPRTAEQLADVTQSPRSGLDQILEPGRKSPAVLALVESDRLHVLVSPQDQLLLPISPLDDAPLLHHRRQQDRHHRQPDHQDQDEVTGLQVDHGHGKAARMSGHGQELLYGMLIVNVTGTLSNPPWVKATTSTLLHLFPAHSIWQVVLGVRVVVAIPLLVVVGWEGTKLPSKVPVPVAFCNLNWMTRPGIPLLLLSRAVATRQIRSLHVVISGASGEQFWPLGSTSRVI